MPRRSNFGELVAAVSGVAAVCGLFFDWYGREVGPAGAAATGWQSLTAIDIAIAVLGVLAVAHWIARGSGWLERPLPVAPAAALALAGAVVFVLAALRIADVPDAAAAAGLDGRRVGSFVALAAGAGIVMGAIATLAARGEGLRGRAGAPPRGPVVGEPGRGPHEP